MNFTNIYKFLIVNESNSIRVSIMQYEHQQEDRGAVELQHEEQQHLII